MGSFRLAAGRLHLHKHFNFAESQEETVWPSLRHSCRSELTRQEFRYLRTVIVTAAVYRGFDQELAPHHLTFRHRAGVTPYTSTFVFAECCVFIKQSQPPFHCNPIALREQVSTRYRGTPSPEVTVLICRVPSPEFSQAP